MKQLKITASLAVLCALAGCSSGQQFQSFARSFPSEQTIEDLKKTDANTTFRDSSSEGRVPHWKLTGPLPTTWGSQTVRSSTPVGQRIDKAFSKAKMTESMSCAARETGIFYAHYEKYPFRELRDFIGQRCGAVGGGGPVAVFQLNDSEASEATVAADAQFGEWANEIAAAYDKKNWEFGVWFGSGRTGTYAVVAADQPGIAVKPIPLDVSGRESVVIEGEVLVEADAMVAVATKGRFDYSECTTNSAVELPEFQIECPVDPTDETVSISVARGREEDVFTRGMAAPRFWSAVTPTDMFVATGAELPATAKQLPLEPGDAPVENTAEAQEPVAEDAGEETAAGETANEPT